MGVPLIVVGVSILLSAAAAAYAIYMGSKGKGSNMGPQGLDGFSVTQAREGSVVPLIFGRVRVPGNIIWYGNVTAEEIEIEQSGTGKGGGGMTGGGSAEQSAGYRYYLDVWQSIGLGKLSLIDTYVNDNKMAVECASQTLNDGTGTEYPTEPGEYATKIKGVSHIFFKKMLCGDNSTSVPTVHFIVERELSTGLPHENLANGSNPAAAVYDVLIKSGVPADQIAWDTFEDAANYWHAQGLGINLVFSDQKGVDEIINTILSFVDGIPYEDSQGRYAISAYDPTTATADTIETDDFIEFSMRRPGYAQLANHFDANFIDEDQDFSQREAGWENGAVIALLDGKRVNKGIDMTAFRDLDTVSKRLAEYGKRATYPAAEFSFRTNLAFSMLQPGDIVDLENSDVGIDSAVARITSVEIPEIDKNEVAFTATQVIEAIFDANYVPAGGSVFNLSPMTPSDDALFRAQVVMPYTRDHGSEPHTLFLIDRKKQYESGFSVLARNGEMPVRGSDFSGHWEAGDLRTFARKVTLQTVETAGFQDPVDVSGNNYTIDDSDDGILLYTDTELDLANYPAISREELFAKNRFLFVSHATAGGSGPYEMGIFSGHSSPEFICFQLIESVTNPYGPGYDDKFVYRIRHFLRGALNSQKISHSVLAGTIHAWLVKISDNVLQTAKIGAWQKILLRTLYSRTEITDTTDYYPELATFGCAGGFDPKNIAMPGKIIATRTGSTIDVIYWPASMSIDGAGDGFPDEIETPGEDDAIYEGKLYITCDGTTVELSSPTNRTSFTVSGATAVAVRHASALVPAGAQGTANVAADDGEYTGWTTRDNY